MKSEDILDWYPAQLPPVKIILGNAVPEVGKLGRPINARTLHVSICRCFSARKKAAMIKSPCKPQSTFCRIINA